MSAILLDGSIVHYEVLGRGRPVVFLHGWVGSWKYWIASMQVTSTSFRAYALDLWVFGDTAKNALKYSLDEQVKLLDAFLNEMGIGKIALVGHGLGALVGMKSAIRFRQSVDRVMAINCPIKYTDVDSRLWKASPQELSLESNLNEIASSFVTTLASRFVSLTPTELRVASLIKDGRTTKEIAALLHLSENTIQSHKYHIRSKLGLKNRKANLRSYLRSVANQ